MEVFEKTAGTKLMAGRFQSIVAPSARRCMLNCFGNRFCKSVDYSSSQQVCILHYKEAIQTIFSLAGLLNFILKPLVFGSNIDLQYYLDWTWINTFNVHQKAWTGIFLVRFQLGPLIH